MRGSLRPVALIPPRVGPNRAGPGTTIPSRRRQRTNPDPNREPPQTIAGGGAAASLAKGSIKYLSRCVCPEFAK
jgi:hypothetical protein